MAILRSYGLWTGLAFQTFIFWHNIIGYRCAALHIWIWGVPITSYIRNTVLYGIYGFRKADIRFWPTLHIWCLHTALANATYRIIALQRACVCQLLPRCQRKGWAAPGALNVRCWHIPGVCLCVYVCVLWSLYVCVRACVRLRQECAVTHVRPSVLLAGCYTNSGTHSRPFLLCMLQVDRHTAY